MKKDEILRYFPIETERLILRQPTMDDVDAIQAGKEGNAEALIRWMSWTNPHGMSRAGTIEFVNGNPDDTLSIPVIGVEKGTGAFVISTGFDSEEGLDDEFSIVSTGWWVSKTFEGKGYAVEAMREIFNFLSSIVGTHRVTSGFYDGNVRSKALMERLGMVYVGESERQHHTMPEGVLRKIMCYEVNLR